MRNLIFLILLLSFSFGCKKPKKEKTYDYDVIVVGGGLAGLAAAHELGDMKVLILEKDSILGGRVRTANYLGRYYYDLGAVFALDSVYRNEVLVNDNEIIEKSQIAIYEKGNLYYGKNPFDCILQLPNIDRKKLIALNKKNKFNPSELDNYLYDALNIQIKAVFPGSLKNYNQNISAFSWVRYNSSHFEHGNAGVIQYFLKNNSFDLSLNSEVTALDEMKNYVKITYVENGVSKTLTAKKAIVATPAFVSKAIITQKNQNCSHFLSGVKYAGYYSISIGVKGTFSNPEVSYLMPLGTGYSSIVKNNTIDSTLTIFQLYIAQEDFSLFKDEAQIKEKSIAILKEIWKIEPQDIAFYDLFLWKNAGVIINNHYLKNWKPKALRPSENVFLAGDYALLNSEVPYGMIPAMTSGKNAALSLKKDFSDGK